MFCQCACACPNFCAGDLYQKHTCASLWLRLLLRYPLKIFSVRLVSFSFMGYSDRKTPSFWDGGPAHFSYASFNVAVGALFIISAGVTGGSVTGAATAACVNCAGSAAAPDGAGAWSVAFGVSSDHGISTRRGHGIELSDF